MKSVVVDLDGYDWEGDRPLGQPFRETVIYEAHVARVHRRTRAPASRRRGAGRTPGSSSKIPYLVDLGDHRGRAPAGLRVRPTGRPGRAASTTGATSRSSFFAPHAGVRQRPGRRPAPSTSSATWSRRSTEPASRSSSTSSTTTPPRSARTGRPSRSAASPTTTTTCSTRPATTATTAAAATRSTPTARSSAG